MEFKTKEYANGYVILDITQERGGYTKTYDILFSPEEWKSFRDYVGIPTETELKEMLQQEGGS